MSHMYLRAYCHAMAERKRIEDEERRLQEAEFMAELDWTDWELRVYDHRITRIHERLAAL